MIVVSDTSPLNYLVLIEAIEMLPKLFKEVYTPLAVLTELSDAGAPHVVREWAQAPPGWLKIAEPSVCLPSTARLDPGEARAISLAKEKNIAAILIDERRGSKVAIKEGLSPLPTLAVLELAAERGLVDLRLALQKLLQTSMRLPAVPVAAALARDDERRRSSTSRRDD